MKDQRSKTSAEDLLTLALRLYGEDPVTFSPETAEVMERMQPEIDKAMNVPTNKRK